MNEKLKQDILSAQNGDEEALARCVTANTGLVHSLINRYPKHQDYTDLYQIGCLGLVKAIKNFDFSYEVMFSTYAVPIILGEIKRYFRDDGRMRVSRRLKENYLKITAVQESLWQTLGHQPTVAEIANQLSMEKEEVLLALEANQLLYSIDEKLNDTDDQPLQLSDVIGKEDQDVVMKLALRTEIGRLTAKEQLLLSLRYEAGLNQQSVAQRLNMTQVQVSRLERKILLRLKEKLNAETE